MTMWRKKIPVYSLFFVILLSVTAAPVHPESLKDNPGVSSALHLLELWMDAQCAYENIPGISMAVVHDQDVLWKKGFGYTDLDKKTPATPGTIYSICSISKLFTSIGVMRLRDEGKLNLRDAVATHLPWFSIKQTYPGSPSVTVQGLLTHSSGLPRESDFPYWSAPDFPFPTREKVKEQLPNQSTLYPADTYFQYSNLGLTLAGEIVAQVSGLPYEAYVKTNILDPLGLKDTRPELPEEHRGGRFGTGYGSPSRKGVRSKVPFFQARGIAPAAGYSSSVEDLAKFAAWQFRLLEKGGTEVLNANTLREMHRVHWMDPDWEMSWGLGFNVYKKKDKTFVGHQGSCPGFRSAFVMQPGSKIAVIFMSNANGVDAGKFAHKAYEILSKPIAKALKSPGKAKPADPSFQKYTGTYDQQPWGGETAVFNWKGGLAMITFPTNNPVKGIRKLKHIGGDTFRRIRDNDKLGEEIVFIVDKGGKVTGYRRHSNSIKKVK